MSDLFVCQYGEVRSPTPMSIAMSLADTQNYDNYFASCCGLERPSSLPSNFSLFDRVFALDSKIEQRLLSEYAIPKEKIINLNVSDTHSRSERNLRILLESELREKLLPYFPPLTQ